MDDSLQKFGHGEKLVDSEDVPDLLISPAACLLDYFDLYLIHSPLSGKQTRLDTWRALIDAKKAEKIKSIGVSN